MFSPGEKFKLFDDSDSEKFTEYNIAGHRFVLTEEDLREEAARLQMEGLTFDEGP